MQNYEFSYAQTVPAFARYRQSIKNSGFAGFDGQKVALALALAQQNTF
jgi:hypothetical protein